MFGEVSNLMNTQKTQLWICKTLQQQILRSYTKLLIPFLFLLIQQLLIVSYTSLISLFSKMSYKRQDNYIKEQERQSLQNRRNNTLDNSDHKQYSFQSKYSPYKHQPINSNKNNQDNRTEILQSNNKSHNYDDTEALVYYQLKREQQKTRILQQRLKNKEIFINNMKELQNELTLAFDESQEELNYYKSKFEQTNLIQNRQLIEEIAELKHLIIQLQDQNKRLTEINKRMRSTTVPSQKNNRENINRQQSRQRLKPRKDRQYDSSNKKQNSMSQKDLSLQNEQMAKKISKILNYSQEQINHESKRIGKFLFYFFSMVSSCNKEIKQPSNLRQRLKFAWTWIKSIVKQSIEIKSQYQKDNELQLTNSNLFKILKVDNQNDLVTQVQAITRQNKHYSKIIKLICQYYRLSPQTNLKKIQQLFRDKIKNS